MTLSAARRRELTGDFKVAFIGDSNSFFLILYREDSKINSVENDHFLTGMYN